MDKRSLLPAAGMTVGGGLAVVNFLTFDITDAFFYLVLAVLNGWIVVHQIRRKATRR